MANNISISTSPFHPVVERVAQVLGEVPRGVGSIQAQAGALRPAQAIAPTLAQNSDAQLVSSIGSTSLPPSEPSIEMQHEPTEEEIFGTPTPSAIERETTTTPLLNTPIPLFPPRQATLIDPSVLLDLRKKFKRLQSQLHRVSSHKEFLQTCMANNTIPQGLQIKKTCNAIFPEGTNVTTVFQDVLRQAERDLLQSLLTHYTDIETMRTRELQMLETQMSNFHGQLTSTDLEEHNTMLAKTKANLNRTNEKRSTRKTNKLNRLKEPNRRQGGGRRQQQPRQQQDRPRPPYRGQDARRPPFDCGGYGYHYAPPPQHNYNGPPPWRRYGDRDHYEHGYDSQPSYDPHLYHPPPSFPPPQSRFRGQTPRRNNNQRTYSQAVAGFRR